MIDIFLNVLHLVPNNIQLKKRNIVKKLKFKTKLSTTTTYIVIRPKCSKKLKIFIYLQHTNKLR